jgi:hypothetical protein
MELVDVNIDSVAWALCLREGARGNPSAISTLHEYLSKIDVITKLARDCLHRLEPGDCNYPYFHLLSIYGEAFKATLHPSNTHVDPYAPPTTAVIAPHENSLRRLALFHNRAAGKRKNTKPGLFNAIARLFESGLESDVPDMDPDNPKTRQLLPRLLEAMRAQINAANDLTWSVG